MKEISNRRRPGKECVPTARRGRRQDGPVPQETVATAVPAIHGGQI